jgi:hypothetical protein
VVSKRLDAVCQLPKYCCVVHVVIKCFHIHMGESVETAISVRRHAVHFGQDIALIFDSEKEVVDVFLRNR